MVEQQNSIRLKVAEAIQDDVNKGIVRIDSSFMNNISVKPGDIVEIEGERKTVAMIDRAYPGDIGLNIIRMDGIIRRNAKTGIGELIKVTRADFKEAKKVVIAPAKKGIMIRASSNIFKQGLLGRAVIKGDIVALGGASRRRTTMSQSRFFEDVFGMLDEDVMGGFGFGDIKFVVADTNPKQPVIISESTEVVFNPEATEVSEESALEVTYEDIGGLEDEMQKIREMVELPLKHPEIFERLGIDPPKGVLLHGPPGTGKTLLAKAVANETNSNFILINGPEIMSKFYGQSEENLRKKFEDAEKNAPSIIFIDEIDAIASKREETHGEVERRVVAQLLALMDGLKSRGKVVVIAASNIPNSLDPALRRPGRFDREIEIGVPGKKGRLNILKIHTRNMPIIGELYGNILQKNIPFILDNKLKSIDEKIHKREEELSSQKMELKELEKQKVRGDHSLLDRILNSINRTNEKISKLSDEIKHSQKDMALLNDIKEALSQNKKLLIKLASEIKEIDDCKFSISDPRGQILENKKSKIHEELEALDDNTTIREIVDKSRREGLPKDLESLANITHGFVGADLAALAKETAMIVLRRVYPDLKLEQEEAVSSEALEKLNILHKDFKEALKVVRPSALREVLIEIPNVTWDKIGGLEDVKQELNEAVEWPLKNPDVFKRMGVRPPRGILLYGPPGTGKTLLAKAVAKESEANFISVKGPELISKWVGESEKGIRKVFAKARQASPSIIFFDEIDAIAPKRGNSNDTHGIGDKVVNQLLTEMNGLEDIGDVVVIAATNRPDILDTALLRPGRFDRIILTSVPDEISRFDIFKVHTKDMPIDASIDAKEIKEHKPTKKTNMASKMAGDEPIPEDSVKVPKDYEANGKKEKLLKALAQKTDGYVGADIEAVCREAAMIALREDIKADKVTPKHFEKALLRIRPSVTKEIEKAYKDLKDHFSSARAEEMKEEKPSYMG